MEFPESYHASGGRDTPKTHEAREKNVTYWLLFPEIGTIA